MMPFCKKTAQVSNGMLAVDVMRSKVPGVVHVDLKATPFAHFHVRSNDEGSVLGYSDSTGRFSPIALFADRKDADAALAAVSRKLLQPGLVLLLLKLFLGVLLAFTALLFLDWAFSHMPAPARQAAMPVPGAGMPTDADKLFNADE